MMAMRVVEDFTLKAVMVVVTACADVVAAEVLATLGDMALAVVVKYIL